MSRIERTSVGDYVYHVLNRANARVSVFDNDKDYHTFEAILEDAVAKFDMRLLSYCIMPNHWHLVLYPKKDGDLIKFMGWLSNTHTRRWHMEKHTMLPESKCAVISEISNASKMERNGAVKMENTDALF